MGTAQEEEGDWSRGCEVEEERLKLGVKRIRQEQGHAKALLVRDKDNHQDHCLWWVVGQS